MCNLEELVGAALGAPATAMQKMMIRGWMSEGIEQAVIEYAVTETGMAPRPSWRYMIAIMNRIRAEGLHTLAEVEEAQRRRRSQTAGAKVNAQRCQQREYTDSDEMPEWMRKRLEEDQRKRLAVL
jgi:DnaD/phage-associated family protein